MQLGAAFFLPRDTDADLDRWLEPFLDAAGRSTRRKMAPLYVRGLLGSGGRKSIQPMAERLGLSGHDQLHHFISSPAWDDAPLWRVLAEQADRQVGGEGAVLVVDDTGLPKKGALSVGVARQYCGALGKVANCQVLVSLTLARGAVPLPVGLRLFLPAAWTDDPGRCEAAVVPEAARSAQTKPEIALAEIDRVCEAGLRFSCVLADAGFGSSPAFRHGLDRRALAWAVGTACTQLVYPATVKLRPARTPSGRAAKHPRPSRAPRTAAEMLETQRWRRITWRNGTKGPLNARFAALRVRAADGPTNADKARLRLAMEQMLLGHDVAAHIAAGSLMGFAIGATLFGSTVILPQYVQSVLGFTATLSGELILVRALAIALMTPFIARFATTGRLDTRIILGIGFAVLHGGIPGKARQPGSGTNGLGQALPHQT